MKTPALLAWRRIAAKLWQILNPTKQHPPPVSISTAAEQRMVAAFQDRLRPELPAEAQ